jgi:Rps23 Pro-64 3,4-dihydroxylase Tpa1-like proline 4-hydroxylase
VFVHLLGAGLHQIARGGVLGIHADFNRHPDTGLWRRVNVFLYLNDGWSEEYGGHLELWYSNMSTYGQRILPTANRLVIFTSSRTSFHGHPDPLLCPEDSTRKSIAMYYYSTQPGPTDDAEGVMKNTNFVRRPQHRVRIDGDHQAGDVIEILAVPSS